MTYSEAPCKQPSSLICNNLVIRGLSSSYLRTCWNDITNEEEQLLVRMVFGSGTTWELWMVQALPRIFNMDEIKLRHSSDLQLVIMKGISYQAILRRATRIRR